MARPILLDVDTGMDDALALLYAVAHPDIDLLGVSCVAGNSPLPQVAVNTLQVLEVAQASEVPVAVGAGEPRQETARRGHQPHGANGLGGIELPPPARTASAGATDLLHDTIMASADPVTLVALAPQTNLALLLSQHPEVTDQLAGIVFVGGWADPQHQDRSEFNVWQDPEAASVVMASGIPVTMYAMEVLTQLPVGFELTQRFTQNKSAAVRLAGELLRRRSDGGPGRALLIGDAGALIFLTNPDLFTTQPLPVAVSLTGVDRGRILTGDRAAGAAAIEVVVGVNASAAAAVFAHAIELDR